MGGMMRIIAFCLFESLTIASPVFANDLSAEPAREGTGMGMTFLNMPEMEKISGAGPQILHQKIPPLALEALKRMAANPKDTGLILSQLQVIAREFKAGNACGPKAPDRTGNLGLNAK